MYQYIIIATVRIHITQKIAKMMSSMVENGATMEEYETLRQRALVLARGYQELERESAKLREQLDDNAEIINNAIDENMRLEKENAQLRRAYSEIEDECEKARANNNAAQNTITIRDNDIDKRDKVIQAQCEKNAHIMTELLDVRAKHAINVRYLKGEIECMNRRIASYQSNFDDVLNQLIAEKKKSDALQRELDCAIDEIIKLQTPPTTYRYKVMMIGSQTATARIEYRGKIYYPESYETEMIFNSTHRTLYFATDVEIDITDKSCELISLDQKSQGYYPITFSKIE